MMACIIPMYVTILLSLLCKHPIHKLNKKVINSPKNILLKSYFILTFCDEGEKSVLKCRSIRAASCDFTSW